MSTPLDSTLRALGTSSAPSARKCLDELRAGHLSPLSERFGQITAGEARELYGFRRTRALAAGVVHDGLDELVDDLAGRSGAEALTVATFGSERELLVVFIDSLDRLCGYIRLERNLERENESRAAFRVQFAATLYRPVGPEELELIKSSGWKAFPSRLPEQPIFYPVVEKEYAIRIARDWNVKASGSGYVTRFRVDSSYLRQFPVQEAGGRDHTEYWIPAERLAEFNEHIVGAIEVVEVFHADAESEAP